MSERKLRPPKDAEYLGDGAYASFDGMHVILWAERENGWNWVALDDQVLAALDRYIERLKKD